VVYKGDGFVSVRERNRYATAVAAFLIAFGILCALFLRSAMVMAQITFTWRPQGATTDTYQGGNLTDCGSEITISATQGLGLAFDQNLTTAATTYTDADISIDNPGMAVGEEDTTFTESGKWSNFRQTTTFITDVDLLVRISGANNSETTRQWAIEYTVDGPISSTWHEMVRFTIYYATVAEEVYLSAGDEILNTALDPADVGYVRTIDTGTDQLVLERYYPGEFESWDVDDTIENLDASFSTTISTASSIEDNPPTGTVLGQVLGNDATRAFLTDDPDDPDYILDVLSSKLAVRTRTKQQGC
jgi:hypothetical protein